MIRRSQLGAFGRGILQSEMGGLYQAPHHLWKQWECEQGCFCLPRDRLQRLRFPDPNLERYASIVSPGNPSLKWERVATFNIGVDWALFNRRVSGSLEFFTKKSE